MRPVQCRMQIQRTMRSTNGKVDGNLSVKSHRIQFAINILENQLHITSIKEMPIQLKIYNGRLMGFVLTSPHPAGGLMMNQR